jgi:hypothetical protein
MSLDWTSSQQASNEPNFQDEPWLQRPGEVFNEPRPYNAATKLLGLKYDHVCGTEEQFAEGAIYDPTLNVLYDEQGLPLCCNGPAVPFFGLVMGFEIEEPVFGLQIPCLTCPDGLMEWNDPTYVSLIDPTDDSVIATTTASVVGSPPAQNLEAQWIVSFTTYTARVSCGISGAGPIALTLDKPFGTLVITSGLPAFCRVPPVADFETDFFGLGTTGTVLIRWSDSPP